MNIKTLTSLRDEIIDGFHREHVSRSAEGDSAKRSHILEGLCLAADFVRERFDAAITAQTAMTSTPFTYHRSEDRGIAHATSTWIERGHKLKIETTSYSAISGKPAYMTSRTSHFNNGAWSEVLPWHGVVHLDGAETIAIHAELVAKTIEFLGE